MTVKVGDWVRFYQGGELVIGGSADFAGGTITFSSNGKIKTEAGKSFRVNADGRSPTRTAPRS